MVVWTILGHFGPVPFPTVPRPLPTQGGFVKGWFWRMYPRSVVWGSGISKIIAFSGPRVALQGKTLWWRKSPFCGTSAKTILFEMALLRTPEQRSQRGSLVYPCLYELVCVFLGALLCLHSDGSARCNVFGRLR